MLSGKISRGRYTFLIRPEFATIDAVPTVTISAKRVQAVRPV